MTASLLTQSATRRRAAPDVAQQVPAARVPAAAQAAGQAKLADARAVSREKAEASCEARLHQAGRQMPATLAAGSQAGRWRRYRRPGAWRWPAPTGQPRQSKAACLVRVGKDTVCEAETSVGGKECGVPVVADD